MMKKELIVCCFYWTGDRWQKDGREQLYINRLYHMVNRNLTIPFKFICFTNEITNLVPGIFVQRFDTPSKIGVLPRMWMFSEESGLFGHQVLALDLDIVIVGSLDDIASYQGEFCSRSKFAPGQTWKLDGDVTSFEAGPVACERFWTPFRDDPKRIVDLTRGRERMWFREVLGIRGGDRWDIETPGQVVSYKRHVLRNHNNLPARARIVSCHGKPRPHELEKRNIAFVKEHWR